ncbi:GDP-mannose transporter [Vairimorpha necatrix]|uniref:GDP-mannose transporter n=1 Tax=Vairimorpha necatrix TaxID=6039 RepID=A0AAX4JDH7_9MICR
MYLFLLSYSLFDILLTSSTIIISRLFLKDTKSGMLIYFFTNCINLLLALFRTDKVVYLNRYILLITCGFTTSTIFYFLSIYMKMSSVSFNNYYSCKIIIVSVLSISLMRTKYHKMQWIGKSLISLGIMTQFYYDKQTTFSWSIFTALSSGFFNALSTVLFEHKVRDNLSSMWEYLFTVNFCYIPFNLISAIVERSYYKSTNALLVSYFYILIFFNVLSTQASVYLSMNVDSFERTIISVVCNIISSLVSDIIMKIEVKTESLIGFGLVFIGTLLYVGFKEKTNGSNNKLKDQAPNQATNQAINQASNQA